MFIDEEGFFSLTAPLADDLEGESSISLGVEDFVPLSGRAWWQTRPIADISGADLLGLASDLRRLQADAGDPTVSPGAELLAAGLPRVLLESELLDLSDRVVRAKNQIDPAITSVEITVAAVGMVVIGLGGWFVARRRQVELRMWVIEGRSPAGLGSSAALGATLPAAVGALMGVAVAPILVSWFGPSSIVHRESVSVATIAVFTVAGLVVIGLTTALVARRILEQRVRSRSLRWVWDLALYGVAVTLLIQLLVRDPVNPATGEVDLGAMFFPIVGVGALVAGAMRLVSLAMTQLRRRGAGLPIVGFLAWRRIVAAASGNLGMVFPIGVAAGVVVFSSALVASLDGALEAKSIVSVGSNTQVVFARSSIGEPIPPGFSLVRFGSATAEGQPSVLLQVVDPESYPEAVVWDSAFGAELADVMASLADATGERLPAVVTGPGAGRVPVEGARRSQRFNLAYEVVGELDALPGMAPDRPTLLVRRDTVIEWARGNETVSGWLNLDFIEGTETRNPEQLFLGLQASLISTVDREAFTAFLDSIGHPTNLVVERDDALTAAAFTAPRWAFDYLRLLAFVAMGLAIGVYAFSIAEGRRRLVLAQAMAGRMGVGRVASAAVLGVEVVALIGLATLLGIGSAAGLAYAVIGEFDPLPGLFPALETTLSAVDVAVAVAVALVAGVVVWWATLRAAARTDVVEVLRVG